MDSRDNQDGGKPFEPAMTPSQSIDDSPSMANRRRARPFSLLSYNPVLPQLSSSPSPLPSDPLSRHASFSSASRPAPASGTPSKRPSRWTVIIIPPALLPHSPPPPHVSGFAQGYGPSGRYSTGLILPLQPTLTLQLTSIAREFSLPSTGGLTLHLSISSSDQPSIPGPRVTDESWSVLFGWTFDDTPPPYAGLQPSIGLPIAGRLEFDIDLKKARWFDAWAASSQTTNRLASQVQYSLKIPSANSTPGANRAPDPSSLPQAAGTPSIALPRRRSSQSSVTYDTSRDISKQFPVTISEHLEDGFESPTPNKAFASSEKTIPASSPSADSSETLRQQLERLVESEDSALAEENNWHIQQENMLRQAAIEREQIELADRLEEERRIKEENQNLNKDLLQSNQQIQQNSSNTTTQNSTSRTLPMNPRTTETKIQSDPTDLHATSNSTKHEDTSLMETRSMSESADETRRVVLETSARSVDETARDMTGSMQTQLSIELTVEEKVSSQQITEMANSDTKTTDSQRELVRGIESKPKDLKTVSPLPQESRLPELTLITESITKEQVEVRSSHSQSTSTGHLMRSNVKSTSPEEVSNKHKSEPSLQRNFLESESSSFSATLGRSVNRFSGEQELLKRRNKTEQGDEETQKLIDEMNRLVNEKAMAKEASILLNPKRIVSHDSASPVKATLKAAPPPPPTRSKVVQLARAFSPSDERPAQRSPRSEAPSRDNSPAIPTVPILPATSDLEHNSRPVSASTSPAVRSIPLPPTSSEPAPDVRPVSVIQGGSIITPATRSVPLPPSTSEVPPEPRPQLSRMQQDSFSSSAPKSRTSSVSSSPSTRTLSLFKPHLSVGSNLLSSIFRGHSTSSSIDFNAIAADPLAPLLHCYGDTGSLSEKLATYIVNAQDQALERHNKFVVAITGGSIPMLLASGLLENPDVKWDTWKVFFADEKIVPLDNPDSNFANSMAALFEKAPIDRSQLVGILGLPSDDIDLDELGPLVSSIYMAQVLEELDPSPDGGEVPRFDLILLDVGEDGHTCSLFPSHRLLDDTAIISWCNDSVKPPTHRITMTLPVLNAAHNLAFVCIGSSKDEILRSILEQEPSPTRPASLVKLAHKPVVWFVDEAAAAKTQYPRTAQEAFLSHSVQSVVKTLATDGGLVEQRASNGLQLEGISSYSATQVVTMSNSILNDTHVMSDAVCKSEGEPNGLLFSGTREELDTSGNQFGYPYNLQIYLAVYPHVDQLLYCPPVPKFPDEFFLTQKVASRRSLTEDLDQSSISTKVECETAEHVKESDERTTDVAYSECTRVSADWVQEMERGYPFNLTIYPFVYPHLEDKLYGAAACDGQISPPFSSMGLLPPMVSLIPKDVRESRVEKFDTEDLQVGQEVKLTLTSSHGTKNSIEYPYNLAVYPAVYPHVQNSLYLEMGPRCSTPTTEFRETQFVRQSKRIPAPLASFSSQVTQSRGIAFGNSPEVESHPTEVSIDQLQVTKSPVAIAPATLTEAFHSPIRSLKTTPTTRVFAPSLPYTQRETNDELVSDIAVSPLALRAAASTLHESYYNSNISIISQSRETRADSSIELVLSPVQIVPSTLAESFYHDDSAEPSKTLRAVSPSVPFTHPTTEQPAARSPSVPAAALEAPPSALGEGFFTSSPPRDSSTEVAHVQFNEKTSAEDSSKDQQQEVDRHDGADRHSEGSYSHFSKGDSINSHVTLHQSTDDDWPPTPHSSEGVPSPDSANGLVMRSPMVREVHASSTISVNSQFSAPKSPLLGDQALSASIESNHVSQGSMLSPSVAQLGDGSVVEITNGSDSDLPAQSTPRASIVPPARTLSGTLAESEHVVTNVSFSEVSMHSTSITRSHTESIGDASAAFESQSKETLEVQTESTPKASSQSQLESIGPSAEASDETQSTLAVDSLDYQLRASQDEHTSINGLGIDFGQAADNEKNASNSEVKVERQLSNLETSAISVDDNLIHSSDRFECHITPLDKIAETTWATSSEDPLSPPRLPSPSLIDRLLLTPGTPSSINKQFPGYEAHLTGQDEEAFTHPPTIEVAWDCPQIPLSEVGFASPPRPTSIPLNPTLIEHPIGIPKEPSPPENPNLNEEDVSSVVLDDETTTTPGSPFFLDQGPSGAGPNHAVVGNLSSTSSPVHAISNDRAIPDPSPGRVSIERSFPVSYDSRMNSPLLPPLNLAMDLSDPLSAASSGHLDGYDSPKSTTEEGLEQTSPEQSTFGDQSNGINLDQVLERSVPRFSRENSDELVTEPTTNVSESLPSITKRAPTPASDDVGVALEQVSIDEAAPSPLPILLPFEDLDELSEALAQFIFEAQEVAFQRHGKFQLAMGGSVLPQILGAGLVGDDRMRWDKWEIFLVEEAIAPLESPESVLSAITESIIQHVPIPRTQVHSIAELTKADLIETAAIPEGLDSLADSLADEYENKLLELFPEASHETAQPPEFDLILISVGEEGQVGSLYPSHPMLGESNWFVAWLGDAWEPPSHRITLTLPVLNAARQFAFLAIGQELAEIVADGLDRSIQSDVPMDEDRVNPTALVKSSNLKPVVWFTDFAAAALTDYPKSTFWDEP